METRTITQDVIFECYYRTVKLDESVLLEAIKSELNRSIELTQCKLQDIDHSYHHFHNEFKNHIHDLHKTIDRISERIIDSPKDDESYINFYASFSQFSLFTEKYRANIKKLESTRKKYIKEIKSILAFKDNLPKLIESFKKFFIENKKKFSHLVKTHPYRTDALLNIILVLAPAFAQHFYGLTDMTIVAVLVILGKEGLFKYIIDD